LTSSGSEMKSQRSSAVIAIVDDDDSVRSAIANLLRSMSWQVLTFSSADELLADTRRDDLGLVISDIQMPGMDGFALLQLICEWERTVPVFLVTAYVTNDLQERSLASGASDFFGKPLDEVRLLERIDEILRN
jgi:FixJ family two-component response regulator